MFRGTYIALVDRPARTLFVREAIGGRYAFRITSQTIRRTNASCVIPESIWRLYMAIVKNRSIGSWTYSTRHALCWVHQSSRLRSYTCCVKSIGDFGCDTNISRTFATAVSSQEVLLQRPGFRLCILLAHWHLCSLEFLKRGMTHNVYTMALLTGPIPLQAMIR